MRLFLLPMLLAVAGWFGLANDSAGEPCERDCSVTVECIDDDSCLVTCADPDGEVVCQQVLECDRPCDSTATECAAKPADSACRARPGCMR